MSYGANIKNDWKKIEKDVKDSLAEDYDITVYLCKDGFIPEISFTKKDEGIHGFSYQSDYCTQGLLKRIAALVQTDKRTKVDKL